MIVRATRVRGECPPPAYKTEGAAGLDLAAHLQEPLVIEPGERALVPTGWSLEIPVGYEGQVRPRSGLAAQYGVTVLNAPGTIDSDYRGELKVLLVNFGRDRFTINSGDRIAQLVIAPTMRAEVVVALELSQTERSDGGFGSTGRR